MDYRSLLGNMSVAFASQGVAMCLSVITSLLVPKVLGVEEFGYWQLFLLYASYTGFFHFGVNDGVYLLNGGRSRGDLDRRSVASQLYVATAAQAVIAAAMVAVAITGGFGEERRFVLVATAVYMLVNNAASYLGFVFQAVNETKLFSFSVMVDRLVFLAPLAVLLILRADQFEPYVASYGSAKVAALLFCAWKGRDVLRVRPLPVGRAVRDALASMRVGVKLMLANVASMLVLGVMRVVVDAAWGIEAFGEVSFSLTMVNFFLVFVGQASMVLFPALRRAGGAELGLFFERARAALALALPAVYVLYFPAKQVLSLWLPQYEASLVLFPLLLPVCVFDSRMSLLGTTFFKVLRWEGRLLALNAAAVALSLAASLTGVYALGSVEAMALGAAAVIAARSVVAETMVARHFGRAGLGASLGELMITAAFIVLTSLLDDAAAMIAYSAVYAAYLLASRRIASDLLSCAGRRLGRGRRG
ncbi:hypothetical protein [Adlercreutzia sp. ZJ473]|uniref:hypothetical protein n=1 Tax=Adlercreutzia sp. ZJ473 TaxID=2722822 RepID=UPI0015522E5F|nr:hypothetical protein [Adlercreutzia sp. ZJ473]